MILFFFYSQRGWFYQWLQEHSVIYWCVDRVGADISGLRQGLKNAQKDVAFFGRNVTGSMKEIQGRIATAGVAIGAGFAIKSGVQDAMRYEALMTTLGETLGQSRKDFEEWQKSVGTSLGFSMLQGAELANMLSLNFKTISKDAADLTKKTTDMMELAAVVSNKRGMTMQDVSDRIRSAMNQEADGADELGVNVRIAAIKTSQAYQEMANGAPWDQLSESMRKTILYHHIFEQVNKNLGMTMQDTTAMRMAAFTATLANVRLALGQAFLPIAYTVLPLLTKMAQALYRVLVVIGGFMRSLFGGGFKFKPPVTSGDVKTTNQQATALGDMGEAAKAAGGETEKAGKKSTKAAKKAKDAWKGFLAGFDEVNTIPDKDTGADTAGAGAGGGGAGGGVGDLGAMESPLGDFGGSFEESLGELASKFDKYTRPIRNAFKAMWREISAFFKDTMADITAWWGEHGDTISKAFKNIVSVVYPIFKAIVKFVWDSLKLIVEGVLRVFRGIVTFLAGVFTGDFEAAWDGIKDIFVGIVQAMFGFWNLTFIGGLRKLLVNFLEEGIKRLRTFLGEFKKLWDGGLKEVKKFWDNLYNGVKTVLSDMKRFIDNQVELMQTSFGRFFGKIGEGARNAVKALKEAFVGVASWIGREIVNPIVAEFERIKTAFSKGIGEGFKYIINKAIDGFNNALKVFNDLKNATPFGNKIPNLKVPHLAQGGITNGPMLAVVGDNAGGREVVSPLDKLQGMLVNSVVQAMQMTQGNRTGGGDIILNIDGRSFARLVKPFLDQEQNRIGNDIRIRTY